MSYSLKRNLNRRILTATALFALLASSISGWIAFNEARELQDNLLQQFAYLVESGQSGSVLSAQDSDAEDRMVLQRLDKNMPRGLAIPAGLNDGLHTLEIDGKRWRVFIYNKNGNRFAISQQTDARDEVALSNGLYTLLPVLLLAPLLMVITSLAIRQSVKPVIDLAETVDLRDESRLEKLPVKSVPEEISPFIASINRLLERLQHAITQQRRFVADAAHELRTPVTGLTLLAENLGRASSMEQVHQRITPLTESLKRIQLLVSQLLDLARLQGEPRAQTQRVDLQQITRDVIAELYPLAEKRGIDLGMLRNETIKLNDIPGSLRMLIHNAVDNAIRYTPEGGKIDVSLFVEQAEAVVLVEDSGSGIADAELKEVFAPFYRAGDNTVPGNGLGLTISQEIAERLGGVINLSNRAQGGLRFCYTQALENVDEK